MIVFKGKSNTPPFEEVTVEWHDIVENDPPHVDWTQVHAIADFSGKVVVVSKTTDSTSMVHIPGGHIEGDDEDVEAALRREILEETGGTLVSWKPLGYQKRTDSKGSVTHQLRVYAKVEDIKDETIDYDGRVSYTRLIDASEMLDALGWNNPIGNRILELVSSKFT